MSQSRNIPSQPSDCEKCIRRATTKQEYNFKKQIVDSDWYLQKTLAKETSKIKHKSKKTFLELKFRQSTNQCLHLQQFSDHFSFKESVHLKRGRKFITVMFKISTLFNMNKQKKRLTCHSLTSFKSWWTFTCVFA